MDTESYQMASLVASVWKSTVGTGSVSIWWFSELYSTLWPYKSLLMDTEKDSWKDTNLLWIICFKYTKNGWCWYSTKIDESAGLMVLSCSDGRQRSTNPMALPLEKGFVTEEDHSAVEKWWCNAGMLMDLLQFAFLSWEVGEYHAGPCSAFRRDLLLTSPHSWGLPAWPSGEHTLSQADHLIWERVSSVLYRDSLVVNAISLTEALTA